MSLQRSKSALKVIEGLGADIRPVRFPDPAQIIVDWIPNCAVETAVAHLETYPARKSEYGPGLAGLIDTGRALSGLDYQQILLRRNDFRIAARDRPGQGLCGADAKNVVQRPAHQRLHHLQRGLPR